MRLRSTILFWTVIVGEILVVALGMLLVGTCSPAANLASVNVENIVSLIVAGILAAAFYANAQDSARRGRWVVAGVAIALTGISLIVAVGTNTGAPHCLTTTDITVAVIDAILVMGVLIWLRTKPIARR